METFPALRCFPRRSILCLCFICFMFIACAFYTFFVDSSNDPTSYKYLDVEEIQNEIDFKPPDSVVVHDSRLQNGEISNTQPSSGLRKSDTVYVPDSNKVAVNISKHHKHKQANSVRVTTKYIYLVNTTSSTSTSTSASVYKRTTVATPLDTCELTMKDPKLILLWTSFFDYWDYLPKAHFKQCPRCRNCKVTTDRSKLLESDAVIFHARDMSIVDMPAVRLPHQRWVFYCLESPPYSDFPGLQHTHNMFNWTMTYRADSDIQSPYGLVSKIRPPRKLDMQALEWAWSNKSKSVAWMSSHCPTHGGRDSYAAELRKYIDVDIYGSCGTNSCSPGKTDKCYEQFARKYKFFLAFENTICKDYITEKFFRTLKYNIIPVVFGGADYDKFAPPGSFIDALSFKSPKHLAFFLSGVGKNFKLYSSFFQWRRNYSFDLANRKECQLCSMLHRTDLKPSWYNNLREWWVEGSHCKIWEPKR